MLKSVKLGRRFFAAPAWDKVRGAEIVPGSQVQTDDQIRDYIRRTCSTVFHPVGTCKMGVDEAAVVDPSLKVHGIEGVRVADASIMPTLIGGNTAAPSMMIGEKASDLVLGRPPLPAEPNL
jgi:choline dehydrogenase